MAPLRVLVVAVLLVCAGCSALAPDDGGDRAPYGVDEELDPGIPDEVNGSVEGDRLVPGLTTAGVDNASVLLENHYETLESAVGNGTYTATARDVRTAENGTPVARTEAEFVVDAPDRWYRTANSSRPPAAEPTVSEWWVGGDDRLARYDRPNESVVYRRAGVPSGRPLEDSLGSTLAEAANGTVEPRSAGETDGYVVTADNESTGDDVRRVTIFVRENGLVEFVSFVYTVDFGPSDESTAEVALEIHADGPESLERPDWYEEALEETAEGSPGDGPDDGETTDDVPNESDAEPADGDSGGDDPAGEES